MDTLNPKIIIKKSNHCLFLKKPKREWLIIILPDKQQNHKVKNLPVKFHSHLVSYGMKLKPHILAAYSTFIKSCRKLEQIKDNYRVCVVSKNKFHIFDFLFSKNLTIRTNRFLQTQSYTVLFNFWSTWFLKTLKIILCNNLKMTTS